ncbi:YbdK family carboxylate-amine ligase [Actinosynnema sp. NPDC047251]|uniref:Putative glutamate--cysteine ligase 2 n=1 Tax=Saccharothrix espanaensis (strain ATCC 51144 / DSM 44229 / JCM 9112 / NBRC 15066 / NRRL 15764) TaxID=1179773 RepID=K0K6R3_SACES|nr:YbdK family carboxylate-amine ligase [Saccharothrix espanaensis]CCH32579.1 Glutamate-cysteine ligase GCS2 [Saccharothrix espanaensis DSM 44229]
MRTVGVEEEFLLADPTTRKVIPRAAAVLKRVDGLPAGSKTHRELLDTQVEFASGVCEDLTELHRQLAAGRRALVEAATDEGVLVVPSGTPVLSAPVAPPVDDRYRAITDLYAGQVADYHCCGCHVHVGVPDRDTAIAVVNHLRPWLPTLLALSVNSPFAHGRDTGFGSWRMVEQSRFPGSGPPPRFASAAEHDTAVERLVDCGVLTDAAMTFWHARPSPRYPTVEVRIADTAVTAADAVALAAVTLALVERALDDLAAGREAPEFDHQVLAAATWTAARFGVDGPGVDPWNGVAVPAPVLVRRLLDHVGGTGHPHDHLGAPTGARRQRAAAANGPKALVDWLASACITGIGPGIPPT